MSRAAERRQATRAEEQAAALFFALGDGTRLSVVQRLGEGPALSATMLADGARVSRQAITKHLKVLSEAGLVQHARHGRDVLYMLDAGRVDEARAFLDGISARWDRAIERLRRQVEGP